MGLELYFSIYIAFAGAWAVYSVHMYHVLPRYKSFEKTLGIALQIYGMNFILFPFAVWLANKKKILTVKQYNKYYGKKS